MKDRKLEANKGSSTLAKKSCEIAARFCVFNVQNIFTIN